MSPALGGRTFFRGPPKEASGSAFSEWQTVLRVIIVSSCVRCIQISVRFPIDRKNVWFSIQLAEKIPIVRISSRFRRFRKARIYPCSLKLATYTCGRLLMRNFWIAIFNEFGNVVALDIRPLRLIVVEAGWLVYDSEDFQGLMKRMEQTGHIVAIHLS